MRPSYIILTDSGERFDLDKANDFDNPPQESILSDVVAVCDRFIVTIDPAYKVFDIFKCNNPFRFR